jgi:hypothetical protein
MSTKKTKQIPKTLPNHKWGDIIHDQSVIWLATWKDNIKNKNKYVFTSFESFFKSKSDEEKFDLARKLKKKINTIREAYEKELKSETFNSCTKILSYINTLHIYLLYYFIWIISSLFMIYKNIVRL